jgi:broad specificity phosphatase PhoE
MTMLLLHIVLAFILAALLSKAIILFFPYNRPRVIIITSHNNAIIGYIQHFINSVLPKTVLPNCAVVKIIVRNGYATFSLLTKDGEHPKYLKKEHIRIAFPIPILFNSPNCIIYLVRHGESESNVGTKHYDPQLTKVGGEEAVRAAEAIISDLDGKVELHLVSSPLTRAVQTMDIIKTILRTNKLTVLDARCLESIRDIGRAIHVRGPKATADTIIACDPRHPLSVYRVPHICEPTIDETALENLVAPNRLPSSFDFPGVNTELLEEQLTTDDWPMVAALTSLDELVDSHL